ncbi:MAG: NUDIX domain-containing protein [Clostridia bacterium]|nr:NUDIX domain-containing protein [Clostridia bacterium]
MRGYNLIAVVNEDSSAWLMCRRSKDPYKGMYNLVGGKIEPGEDGLDAAYRELFEETGITREDITLTHLIDYTFHLDDCYVEAYVGRMNKEKAVHGDENELLWMDFDQNYFDTVRFAGEGNIGQILEHIQFYAEKVLL